MGLRWYVIQAFSNYENQVKRVLEERIVRDGMQDYFGRVLVPTEEVVEMRNGQQRKSERKFFPGYVLVQMEEIPKPAEQTEEHRKMLHFLRDIPRVLGFIGGTSDHPRSISDAEADTILNRVETGTSRPRPKVLFEAGEVVRVVDGPFKDFNGVVEEVAYEKSKLRISVLIFGRSTPVELDFGQVEKG